MEIRRAQPMVYADYAEGERLGVNSTPTFVVNGSVWSTTLSHREIEAIVDSIAPVAGGSAGPAVPTRR